MRAPIRIRLTAWYLTVLCFCLAILGTVIFLGARESVANIIDSDLRARMAATRSFMGQHIPSDSPTELQDEFQEFSASQPGGALLQIKGESGDWVFQSLSMQRYGIAIPSPSEASQISTDMQKGHALRIITDSVIVNGKRLVVQIATDTTSFTLVLQRLKWLLLISTPLAIGLALAGGYWLSSRALFPVRRITEAARSIGGNDLSCRLDPPQTADELQFLAETLNAMLARIESSFKQMTQFTADASHELRTPVAIIRTTAEIALRQKRDEGAYRKALQEILEEAERTSSLIDDLLTLARADSATEQLALSPTNVAGVIEIAFSKTKFLASEKGVSVSLDLAHRSAWIEGNQEALVRLFLVLFDNVIKYTPAGGQVSAVFYVAEGVAVFRIQDSGIGIPAQYLPHIFERFYRADQARSRKHGGFGLGLAIAKWIGDAHAAQIQVQSAAGQGSVFTVEFQHANSQPS